MKTTFTTTVVQAEGKKATGLQVPTEAVTALGKGKKPHVRVSLRGYTYRSTVAAYGDVFMLPLSAEHREAAGKRDDVAEVSTASGRLTDNRYAIVRFQAERERLRRGNRDMAR